MLTQKIFIYGTANKGSGIYTIEPYFADSAMAGYVNENDVITDTAGKRFRVQSLATKPNPDGGQLTVVALDGTAPVEDSDYNSSIATPGQISLYPPIQTTGDITAQVTFSAYDYEYLVTASWTIASESNKARIGDSIIDSAGREYVITAIPSGMSSSFRVTEKERLGQGPRLGVCGLYRASDRINAYQGPLVSPAANQSIQNRDFKILDMIISQEYENQIVVNVPPAEDTDGVRMEFTLPFGHSMVPSSLEVSINGLEEFDFEEIDQRSFRLLTSWAPKADDVLMVKYLKVKAFDPKLLK